MLNRFILTLLLVSIAHQSHSEEAGSFRTVTIDGSSPLAQFIRDTISPYGREHHISISMQVVSRSPSYGVECALAKTCQIGMTQEIPKDAEAKLQKTLLGINARGFVVSPDVTVKNVTSDQVREIFMGKIKNWKEIGGSDLPMTVWHRSPKIPLRNAFEDFFNIHPASSNSIEILSNAELLNRLKQTKGVITYNSISYAASSESRIRTLTLDGVEPTSENLMSGAYKFSGPQYLVIHKDNITDVALNDMIKIVLAARKENFAKMGVA